MSEYRYRFTILVPTHQRANLLGPTLRGLLLQDHESYQLVVSNNFSTDATRTVLLEFADDPRVTILHTDRKMSMPEHWEFAMERAEGEHVVILGDDDGVRPDCLTILDAVITQTGGNLLKFKTGLYHHPDWVDEKRNKFEFDVNCSNACFAVDKRELISEFCSFRNYAYFPNLLQACFSLELYRQAKRTCGTVFVGAPDWSCPFLLLAQENARPIYIDATLGYGGRSQMSNAAYYAGEGDEFQNERLKDFMNDLSPAFRLPHHEPQITTAGNFTPAAFSYAKRFYPEALRDFALDRFELSRVIQNDLAEEAVGHRHAFWTPEELASFRRYVDALPPEQCRVIKGLPGGGSPKGRTLLLLKRAKRKLQSRCPGVLRILPGSVTGGAAVTNYPYNRLIPLAGAGITDGYELMRAFNTIVRDSDRNGLEKGGEVLKAKPLRKLLQLSLPMEAV
ncbi:MAG: glycosyltransferase family 2 protein [Acidobacteriota bacterium]|nr:glycosyltransferase family 2 protein [Acidobacteriota bacterium]